MTWHYTATARPGMFYGPFSHAHPSSTWILQHTILLLLYFVMSCPWRSILECFDWKFRALSGWTIPPFIPANTNRIRRETGHWTERNRLFLSSCDQLLQMASLLLHFCLTVALSPLLLSDVSLHYHRRQSDVDDIYCIAQLKSNNGQETSSSP